MDGGVTAKRDRIEGAKTYLVPFAEQHRDDPAYLRWLNDFDVVKGLNLPHYLEGVARTEVAAYYDRMRQSETDLFYALHDRGDDAFVGTMRAGRIDRYAGTADIGILIGARDRWGRGYGLDAYYTLSRFCFDDLGLRKLTGGCMASNPAMARVFERLGYRLEGRFRQQDRLGDEYIDHLHYGCFASELRQPFAQ